MATPRKFGRNWEFVVRRKDLLPRPLYLTFDSDEEGARYCERLEALLKRGVIPDDVAARTAKREAQTWSLDDVINV